MDIYETFRGKTVFFTGVTGFVGKVFLWKILKEFTDFGGAIVLIRTKKGQNPQDRLQKEVFSSPCFEPLRKAIGEAEWTRRTSLVTAVSGDIMFDRLGLSDSDYELVASRTNFIVHMAATVNFDERIDISAKMNMLGSMRVMAIAHKMPNLQAYVHMSTCYVNYQRHGRHQTVREVIYPLPFDAEDMCKFILAQDVSLLPRVTQRVLSQYGFPNTYTLTKAMGEQILERRKGNLPFTIIRPAIVGCAWREPMPGWVDALTAAGGIFLMAGLGVMRELNCDGKNVSDIVPVDYVVNSTLKLLHRTSTYYEGLKQQATPRPSTAPSASPAGVAVRTGAKPEGLLAIASALSGATAQRQQAGADAALHSGASDASSAVATLPLVYQACTSSSLNLMRWETAVVATTQYWDAHPHPKAAGRCDIALVANPYQYQARFFFRRVVPVFGLKIVANLPIVGNAERKKQVTRLERAVFRGRDMQRQFSPFINFEWAFDASNTNSLDESLKPENMKAFSCDPYDINWHAYCCVYSYGMIRYIMKADDGRSPPLLPESGSQVFIKAGL